jgi:hypothetical protein
MLHHDLQANTHRQAVVRVDPSEVLELAAQTENLDQGGGDNTQVSEIYRYKCHLMVSVTAATIVDMLHHDLQANTHRQAAVVRVDPSKVLESAAARTENLDQGGDNTRNDYDPEHVSAHVTLTYLSIYLSIWTQK